MGKYLGVVMNVLTLGNEGQSFLGAKWVESLLRRAPEKKKRQMALTALSWSPHYQRPAEDHGRKPVGESAPLAGV